MIKKENTKQPKRKMSISNLLIFVVFPFVGLIFGFLFLRTEVKFLYKEIYQKEKEVEVVQNMLEKKIVMVQKLTAEDRIVEIAKTKLGLVRVDHRIENISIDQIQIDQIKQIVDSKYE